MKNSKIIQYIPQNSIQFVEEWFRPYSIKLRITKDRKTKLGDYKKMGLQHAISVNGNLDPEAFFFVLTHEFAHLKTYELYKNQRILPHGKEWKSIFGDLLRSSFEVYADDLKPTILNHAQNPKASVTADPHIAKYLIYKDHQALYLESLPRGACFFIGKRAFVKGDKRKIRYLCTEKETGRRYLINGLALVNLTNEKQ